MQGNNSSGSYITPVFKSFLSQTSKIKLYEIFINDNQSNIDKYKHKENYICTTKYNVFTFIPKSLFIQFIRLPNVYFLISAIIQSIPIISPLTNITAIVPLIFVLMVSMVRELIEDLGRHAYDKINNNEKVIVYANDHFEESTAEKLRVGQMVIVKDHKTVPADIIILDSHLAEGNCYIETGSIDGEKALKEKIAHKVTSLFFKSKKISPDLSNIEPMKISGSCQCDYPNADLHRLDGKISILLDGKESSFPISTRQLILKGTIIKHSGWILGLIIYTGMNNKIILNSKNPRIKISTIEKRMNKYLLFIFIFQIVLCAVCASTHFSNYNSHIGFYKRIILLPEAESSLESFITFFTYLLLLNTLIPISLIVTMEIVKVIQGLFIKWDCEMYSKIKKKFCKPTTVSLNEELGNVNYIFSDKTGTLTCNKMEFKYCVIGDNCYMYQRNSQNRNEESESNSHLIKELSNPALIKDNIIPFGKQFFSNLETSPSINGNGTECDILNEFWQGLACVHECVCSETENGIEYTGISPDDVELVKTASDQGYSYLKSPSDIRRLLIGGKEKNIPILNLLNFSSERKRMSIIVKDGDVIKMYIKGADCQIKHRLSSESKQSYYDNVTKYVDMFSSKGYRTLMIAYKTLNSDEYYNWNHKFRAGEMNLIKKKKLVDSYYDEIENNFILLGATMVEDKLQNHVPETIKDLRLSGIKIWVLTGDKIDTAENVAISCNLITKSQALFRICSINGENNINKENMNHDLETFMTNFNMFSNINYTCLDSSQSEDINLYQNLITNPFSILIEGVILAEILKYEETRKKFLKIALIASTVICCRVSPLQKSLVIKSIKNYDKKAITLAIGDGGNDVSMIMEAHIGVGLYGEEGLRAVQASDFSIGEFFLLRRLLFFHGRTNSNRISQMILYFFYKNFFFTINHFFYAFFCIGSGQTIIDDWFITLFNLIFTALPLGVQACTDFDLLEEEGPLIKEMMPFLYRESRENPHFSFKTFCIHLLKGLGFGLFNFIFVLFSTSQTNITQLGYTSNLWYNSMILNTNIIISVSISLLLSQRYIIALLPIVMGITTFAFYFSFVFFVHYSLLFNSSATMITVFYTKNFYLSAIVVCFFCFIVEYAIESQRFFSSNNLSTKLMWLRHRNELDKVSLPSIILKAKENFKLIKTYNLLSNHSVSFLHHSISIQNRGDDVLNLNKKSISANNRGMKKKASDLDSDIIDKAYSKQFSKKIWNMFSIKKNNQFGSKVSDMKPNNEVLNNNHNNEEDKDNTNIEKEDDKGERVNSLERPYSLAFNNGLVKN